MTVQVGSITNSTVRTASGFYGKKSSPLTSELFPSPLRRTSAPGLHFDQMQRLNQPYKGRIRSLMAPGLAGHMRDNVRTGHSRAWEGLCPTWTVNWEPTSFLSCSQRAACSYPASLLLPNLQQGWAVLLHPGQQWQNRALTVLVSSPEDLQEKTGEGSVRQHWLLAAERRAGGTQHCHHGNPPSRGAIESPQCQRCTRTSPFGNNQTHFLPSVRKALGTAAQNSH